MKCEICGDNFPITGEEELRAIRIRESFEFIEELGVIWNFGPSQNVCLRCRGKLVGKYKFD